MVILAVAVIPVICLEVEMRSTASALGPLGRREQLRDATKKSNPVQAWRA